jgi:cell wall-associated NlpC family hydrolase
MIDRLLVICLVFCLALAVARGDDQIWNNVYHSPNRFSNNVKNTFTEVAGDSPSPTPKSHRKSSSKHSLSKKTKAKPSVSPSEKSEASDKSAAESEKPPSSPSTSAIAGGSGSTNIPENAAPMASIKPEALREFGSQPLPVQQLIRSALGLTERNLSYKYGSADPAEGGMDCSGFIYYVLSNAGYKDVPRDSSEQYVWVRKNGDFHAVLSRSGESFELDDLKPGDLMFWSGTYRTERDIPITHVMIYLGREKSTDKPVMVGATDGRSYEGIRRFGVSVFDFKMPTGKSNKDDPDLTAKFEGYASIPGLREPVVTSKDRVNLDQGSKSEKVPREKQRTKPLSNGD